MKLFITIAALLLISGYLVVQYDEVSFDTQNINANVEVVTPPDYADGFSKAYEVIPLSFPEDHGPHPDFQAEWWYYTGNLADEAGNRFGYQFTIFRRALAPALERESEWGNTQMYFAHFTVTDVTGESFEYHERFSRANPGLAGAQAVPIYQVWIDDWVIKGTDDGLVRLKAEAGEIGLDLLLEQTKPPALQGDRGLSQKSAEPGNASYYVSLTNNVTTGTMTTPRGTFEVTGNSWKDQEWSTSVLSDQAVGWDWFSLQLDDDREVTFFNIRQEDGRLEPVSEGIIVDPDGSTRRLSSLTDVEVTVLDTWTSPHSGATYPAGWRVVIAKENIDVEIWPLLSDQELNVSFIYWEGAVEVEGTQSGYGYVEMTGYAESMQGRM